MAQNLLAPSRFYKGVRSEASVYVHKKRRGLRILLMSEYLYEKRVSLYVEKM